MLFTSVTFLFYFFPVLCICYFPFRNKIKIANLVLLTSSLFFYAWGEPVFVLVMLLSIVMNYAFGLFIHRYQDKQMTKFFLCGGGVICNLLILGYFKYLAFLVQNINQIFHAHIPIQEISLPLGISFFTFQSISYLIDLYRKEIAVQKNVFNLALYISLFPQLIAGPIVRYHDIEKQINDRHISRDDVLIGVRRFIIGFSKKILIANTFGKVADEIFALNANELSASLVMMAVVAYTIQIYFDFSAYSDMAIGLGRMFGFHFLENFNYPYISTSIKEFWQRWHISLSSFLRDYLYIPLGGSRAGRLKTYRNLIIVFLLCGLWHGAGWNFILWGGYFGLFLILERMFLGKLLSRLPEFLSWAYAMAVVMFGWLLFRAENIDQIVMMCHALFSEAYNPLILKYLQDSFLWVCFAIALIASLPLFRNKIFQSKNKYIIMMMDVFLMSLFVLSITFLAAGTYNPFIYFRF